MKKSIIYSALAATFLISANVQAADYSIEKTTVVTNKATQREEMVYTIDGIDISLTKTDKVKAKNWKLKESEYAQYLYLMKYTPRGTWSPDIDPPIALGNEAKTEEERLYYAHLMNGIEWERRQNEGAFQIAGIHDIDARLKALNYVKVKDRPKVKKGEFSKTLPGDKLILRSLFVDMNDCDKECSLWVMKQMMQVSHKVQLDLYVANGDNFTNGQLYKQFTIPPNKVTNGDINISRSTDIVETYKQGWRPPFVIQRDDKETKRKGLYGTPNNLDE